MLNVWLREIGNEERTEKILKNLSTNWNYFERMGKSVYTNTTTTTPTLTISPPAISQPIKMEMKKYIFMKILIFIAWSEVKSVSAMAIGEWGLREMLQARRKIAENTRG